MNAITLNRRLSLFVIPAAMFIGLILLMQSAWFLSNLDQPLTLGISLDLLLTVPFIYFLLIRKTDISKTTVVPVMIVGLIIGSYFLPVEHQGYLEVFKFWVLPIIELSVIGFIGWKVRTTIVKYRSIKGDSPDFFTSLKNTCHEVFPGRIAELVAMEVAVIYYGFINWKTRTIQENEYTYHKKSGTPGLLIGLIFVICVETIGIHFLLASWSHTAAWILTALSVYTIFQVFGFAKSLSQRPIIMLDDRVILRYGIMSETEIYFEDIEEIELSRKWDKKDKMSKKMSPFDELDQHNILIHVKKEHILHRLYGFKKKFKTLALHVDDVAGFKGRIEGYIY